MTDEAMSLNDELAAAWDAAEGDDAHDEPTSEVFEPAEGEINTPADVGEPGAEVQSTGAAEPVPGSADTQPAAEADDKPPVGLSIEAREAWKDTPPSVRAELAKREKDYEAGIVKYSQDAKSFQAIDQVMKPYQQLFAMNGGVEQTLPGLLQTASVLQMGAPAQKAELVANLVKQFGVDVRALDNALVGQKPPADLQEQTKFQEMLAPLQQQLQQYQQREQQMQAQSQQQLQQELNDFGSKHEFYADVKSDMADLLEMAANRNRQMTLEEAYKTACAAHPQISKVLMTRESQTAGQRRQRAASSVHGSPGGGMEGNAAGSISEALHVAWDNVGRM